MKLEHIHTSDAVYQNPEVNEIIGKKNNTLKAPSAKVYLAIFGHGNVGGALIKQIQEQKEYLKQHEQLDIVVFAIANSKKLILSENGFDAEWRQLIANSNLESNVDTVIQFAQKNNFTSLIAIDNTASEAFVTHYKKLIQSGFDLVSSNKKANAQSYVFYDDLRKTLQKNGKTYKYETNVGAGLPLVETLKLLYQTGDKITKIRGVFSGTLSYLFNRFSAENQSFSQILKDAIAKGYTEPDPREDLNGNDVARKLLILARELGYKNEFEDINIQNLIPETLRTGSVSQFLTQLPQFDVDFEKQKQQQAEQNVLRYVGELDTNSQNQVTLEVKLVSVNKNTPLGSLKGSDALFEIYTTSYGDNPIVIQGAGAGAEVTARGVFGDVLKIAIY
jgi:bifunctional aspartokinase / homoserine dehydrogenase 1